MTDSRILITGGAGFIGSHLCDHFLREGHHVTCVDSLITGQRANLAHLDGREDFRLIVRDVSEFHADEAFDAILHFASPASPPEYTRHPLETIRAGSTGTWRLLEMAREHGSRFLVASTSEIYGDPLVHPQVESYWGNVNPIGVRAMYDETKRFSEMLTSVFHRTLGTDTRIVRIFNTYGPRMKAADGRVIPNLITQALRGEPMTVYGDGSQTRSFCFYSDLVEGIARLLQASASEPVNLGNPREHTVLELAEIIRQVVGSSSPIRFEPLPQDDPTRRRPDITRARELLAWEPRVSLEDGLRKTAEYFRSLAPIPGGGI